MQVSFVIPLYNCLEHTRECLRTLQSTLPAGLVYEILFVDDGSTDGTRSWLASLGVPCRTLLNDQNLGFAGACNRGAAAARGELLFFLNNDLILLPGWFEPMSKLLERPHVGLVGNIQLNARTHLIDHTGVRFDEKGKPEHDRRWPALGHLRGWREMPAVTGACFGIRHKVWTDLGAFDEGFRNGGEDIDLALRARAVGLRNLISLRSVVRHHVSASSGRKLRDEQNSRRLANRWRSSIVPLAARAWARHHITTLWESSRVFDDTLARRALWVAMGGAPHRDVHAAVQRAFHRETARWHTLLDGAPPMVEPIDVQPARI